MGYYDFPHTRNYDGDLGYLIHQYKVLYDDYKNLKIKQSEFEKALKELDLKLDDYIKSFDRGKKLEETIKTYIATMIFVEINDDGYICYNIPDSWEDIKFNTTGLDIEVELQPNYGHLVLSY